MDFRLTDGRPITIREFEPADLDGMVQMFQAMSKEALQFGLPPYDRPRLERWVTGLGGGVLLVAIDKATVVGVAMVFGRPHPRFKGIGEFVIYLHQEYHNQGLGSFLTRVIIQEVRRKGFHRVGLEVVADNSAAVRVYEKAGFVIEGRLRHAFYGEDGTYRDQLVMGCVL